VFAGHPDNGGFPHWAVGRVQHRRILELKSACRVARTLSSNEFADEPSSKPSPPGPFRPRVCVALKANVLPDSTSTPRNAAGCFLSRLPRQTSHAELPDPSSDRSEPRPHLRHHAPRRGAVAGG